MPQLSGHTVLHDAEAPTSVGLFIACKDRRDLLAQPSVVRNQWTDHRPAAIREFRGQTAREIVDSIFACIWNIFVPAFVGIPTSPRDGGHFRGQRLGGWSDWRAIFACPKNLRSDRFLNDGIHGTPASCNGVLNDILSFMRAKLRIRRHPQESCSDEPLSST
jgi:hypothetical protein